jgi:hypothetical protein
LGFSSFGLLYSLQSDRRAIQAIAKILHQEADPTKLASLAGIEETIRQQTLEHITPQLGFFLSKKLQELRQAGGEQSKV